MKRKKEEDDDSAERKKGDTDKPNEQKNKVKKGLFFFDSTLTFRSSQEGEDLNILSSPSM